MFNGFGVHIRPCYEALEYSYTITAVRLYYINVGILELNEPGLLGEGVEDGGVVFDQVGRGVKLLQLSSLQHQHSGSVHKLYVSFRGRQGYIM